MGLNLMRCHIKVPTEEYLELCDELGLLVWYELPNGDRLSTAFGSAPGRPGRRCGNGTPTTQHRHPDDHQRVVGAST